MSIVNRAEKSVLQGVIFFIMCYTTWFPSIYKYKYKYKEKMRKNKIKKKNKIYNRIETKTSMKKHWQIAQNIIHF